MAEEGGSEAHQALLGRIAELKVLVAAAYAIKIRPHLPFLSSNGLLHEQRISCSSCFA